MKLDYDVLNLGSGPKPMENAVNFDIKDYSTQLVGQFVQGDFNEPLPFDNKSFKKVFMSHALEHCNDIWHVIKEIHRVLKPEGVAVIRVPYYRWPTAFSVLTHKYYFTYRALDSLDFEHELFYVRAKIKFYSFNPITKILTFPLEMVINTIPSLYEISILSVLLPAPEIEYKLIKKVK
jgi:SAM-dependent methyltransferase